MSRHAAKYLLSCALGAMFWPALMLQGAAHLFMVMAVRFNAYRAGKAIDAGAALHAIEPQVPSRKAA